MLSAQRGPGKDQRPGFEAEALKMSLAEGDIPEITRRRCCGRGLRAERSIRREAGPVCWRLLLVGVAA